MSRGREFLHDRGQMPVLWVEGTKEQMKPITDAYGDVRDLLYQAQAAAALGMNFRLDYYTAPIADTVTQEEAHLTVWREVKADACINHRQGEQHE